MGGGFNFARLNDLNPEDEPWDGIADPVSL